MKDGKVQKADREKLRRGRLKKQFAELGKTLDPERPKFDKATILIDTIQMLNDLTAQVDRLKSEYTTLTYESREYQQRVRTMYPWGQMDQQSVVMHPPSYPYPVPMQMPMPPGTIRMHPYPFFGTQNPGVVSNPSSTFYQPLQYVSPAVQPSGRSHVSSRQSSRNKSSGRVEVIKMRVVMGLQLN
ncbi:hypothetical protein L1987_12774 [Smallanthus sonchifolius]|uniref:Uncharacterized protein n=1 Tax=Smallanthus sonchifolius TaxID=185202 RepID=A0ACB9JI69_9ASTR|nr:hypothetical protein L1987_12774 [Smallanthus sonchifolius]